ncbi:MAG: N-acetylglucosamine-6-phosphate deacetylase [Chitinophagaceae bacterium]
MQTNIYSADQIFTGTEWLAEQALVVQAGKIKTIVPLADLGDEVERIDFTGSFIAPAFIDIQLYGASGKLLAAHPTTEAVSLIAKYSLSGGATLCLPTVATNTLEVFYQAIDAVRAYLAAGGKGVWGLHLEGPWINKEKRGAHPERFIHAPGSEEVASLLKYGRGVIRMITVAPEVCNREILEMIQGEGILVSAGHSNATYEEATDAFNSGITTVTHLYNAMSALQHRSPGMVGAVMAHEKVKASIILDGHHVDFAAIRIAKTIMKERLFVITDAVTETSEGVYQHQLVGDKYECNGTLSGSAITMFRSFQNLVNKVELDLDEALRMCSLYPAEVLGCHDQYGKIAPGYAAQFIVVNKQLDLLEVIT